MATTIGTARSLTAIELLDRLIGYDTTSRNSNLELIEFVRAHLEAWGVPCRLSYDPTGTKANIHAIIGPTSAGGLALSGHVDTVPVDGQAWSSDPFTMRRDHGRLYGRGATDMKGFVACMLAAVPDLVALRPRRPVHLLITYDEETGCNGARRLIADWDESRLRPSLCVVGEPTGMRPVIAHKGKVSARVTVRGRPGHSSDPRRGVNAVHAAAEAIAWVSSEARRVATTGPFDPAFDPPYTTWHVGTMQGGTALNIIAGQANFVMEWRSIPGEDPAQALESFKSHLATAIEPAMRDVDPAAGFSVEIIARLPALALGADHELAKLVGEITGANAPGTVSFGTEGGFYQQAGVAAIVCGPGDIALAHQPDEWVAEDQLDRCGEFIRRLADRLCA